MLQTIQNFRDANLRVVDLRHLLYSVALVVVTTVLLAIIIHLTDIRHITIGYVVPVMIAAIRWGVIEAAIAAIMAVAASAFFFYAPIYDFRVHDPLQIVELLLFLLVALVTGHFATLLRMEAERAVRREREIGALYSFARRLAAARDTTGIYDAIQQHIAMMVGRSVFLLGPVTTESEAAERCAKLHVPAALRGAVIAGLKRRDPGFESVVVDDEDGSAWLVRAVSPQSPDFGIIAVDLGEHRGRRTDGMRADIDAALIDAAATLQRLGLGRTLTEARSRTDAERLRDALLGSVSHELRTPLASILGATTALAESGPVKADIRLSGLANVAREESERLNHDIQNLLDATRISSDGIHPKFEWSEPADIVNAAVEHRRARLQGRAVTLRVDPDLPLVYVDSVLIEQALGQVLDNAAKYSPPGAPVDVIGLRTNTDVTLSVTDRGVGFSPEEKLHAGERFFRSERHASNVNGTGLGLWIARSFVSANAGHLEIVSGGIDGGACIRIHLPAGRNTEDSQRSAAWSTTDA